MILFGKYLLVQLPGWILAALILWSAHAWAAVPPAVAAGLLIVWIAKDVIFFPVMRRFYVPEQVETRILRERGTAVTALAPEGFIRVHGELWQARSDRPVQSGAAVRVLAIQGMVLHVAPD